MCYFLFYLSFFRCLNKSQRNTNAEDRHWVTRIIYWNGEIRILLDFNTTAAFTPLKKRTEELSILQQPHLKLSPGTFGSSEVAAWEGNERLHWVKSTTANTKTRRFNINSPIPPAGGRGGIRYLKEAEIAAERIHKSGRPALLYLGFG